MKQLHINCLQCNNQVYDDWDTVLNYVGIRPAQKFGIDTVRFYALSTIFCNKCHSRCRVKLIETTTEIKTQTEDIAILQNHRG